MSRTSEGIAQVTITTHLSPDSGELIDQLVEHSAPGHPYTEKQLVVRRLSPSARSLAEAILDAFPYIPRAKENSKHKQKKTLGPTPFPPPFRPLPAPQFYFDWGVSPGLGV